MGEGADRVRNGSHRPEEVAGEIDTLRTELGGLVAELDRRRQDALDFRLQVRRHPIVTATAATAFALLVGGVLVIAVRRARRRRDPVARVREVRAALGRLAANPRRVAAEPSTRSKLVTALMLAVATTLARRLTERALVPAASKRG